jgi:hypothetical protein
LDFRASGDKWKTVRSLAAGCTESKGLKVAAGFGREQAMKAHEVRLLCRCPVCGKLGDEQAMVKVGPMKTPAHDRCAFEQIGLGVVNLPKEERAKFTLAVVGHAVMRRLNDVS